MIAAHCQKKDGQTDRRTGPPSLDRPMDKGRIHQPVSPSRFSPCFHPSSLPPAVISISRFLGSADFVRHRGLLFERQKSGFNAYWSSLSVRRFR